MRNRFAIIAFLVISACSVTVGLVGGGAAARRPQPGTVRFVDEMTEAIDVIQRNHVDNVKQDHLLYTAIRVMLHTLDPHSSFFDPEEFARFREEEHSTYYGLGITVRRLKRDNGRSVVIEPPVPGSPAARLGIRAGDVLTRIDGNPVDDLNPEEIRNRLRGARGTWVTITLERPGIPNPLQFRMQRDEIPIATVPYAFEVNPGIGYIKIEQFSESTVDELKQKLESLEASRLTGLILDLRNNPGGLLGTAIDVVDLFLPRGQVIVSTKGRARGSDRLYKTVSLKNTDVPLVILINKQSASASEIVAGALQDHDRALIVGETSFGKGLVQSVLRLGGNTGMALTTARYYTPSGRQIQRDYSGAALEYYYSSAAKATAGKPREARKTDSGRPVLGGGGITPDILEPAKEPTRFEALLNSKQAFFEYARRLTSRQATEAGHSVLPLKKEANDANPSPKGTLRPPPEVTKAILDDFEGFLRSLNIEFQPEDIQKNLDFIERGIQQEVCTISYGRQEGLRIAIQSDNQVKRAIAALPDARSLMTTGHLPLSSPRPEGR